MEEGNHRLFVGRAVAKTHSHAAEPEHRDFQPAVAKFAFLHFLNSCLLKKFGIIHPGEARQRVSYTLLKAYHEYHNQ